MTRINEYFQADTRVFANRGRGNFRILAKHLPCFYKNQKISEYCSFNCPST